MNREWVVLLETAAVILLLNFAASFCFAAADRKKIRETNPNEDKFSKAGTGAGEESPVPPPGMNPVINSTSGANMALISNVLAVYTYISGRTTSPPNDQFWCLSKNETAQDYLSKINANDSVTFLAHLWSCPASFPAYTLENREIPNTSLWGPPATVQVTHGLDPYTLFGLLLIWREALAILCDRCSSLCTFYLYRCVYKCLEIDTCSSKLLHIFAPAERTIFLPCRINARHSCAQMTDLEEIRQTPNIGHMAPVKCLTCFM